MFDGQIAEILSLRNNLLEQQQFNAKLEEQLTSAKELQMTTQQLVNGMVRQIQQRVSFGLSIMAFKLSDSTVDFSFLFFSMRKYPLFAS